MDQTILSVIDTAVKIGLGAAIAGISTHVHARWTGRREDRREQFQRKVKALEVIAQNVEEFTHCTLKYWALISEWGIRTIKGDSLPQDRIDKLSAAQIELTAAYKHMTGSEAQLLLLGETKAQKLLREYGETASRFTKKAFVGGAPLSRDESQKCRQEILNARSELFFELSRLYIAPLK